MDVSEMYESRSESNKRLAGPKSKAELSRESRNLLFMGLLAYPGVHHWKMRSDSSDRVVGRDSGSNPGMCWHVRAGDDNLLLAVGEAIEALLSPTPPPPPPTCTGCTPVAGGPPDSYHNSYCCHYTPVKSLKDQVRFATLCRMQSSTLLGLWTPAANFVVDNAAFNMLSLRWWRQDRAAE